MILSMTGFSRKSGYFVWGTTTVEISSVNHRYQEISVRLPREFASLEPAIISKLRGSVGRGKIRVGIEILRNPEYKMASIDEKLLGSYWNKLNEIALNLDSEQRISLTSLLSLPGVSETPRDESLEKEMEKAVFGLLDEAVKAFCEMKAQEGAALASDVFKNLQEFSDIVAEISSQWQDAVPDALAAARARLEKFLNEASGVAADPSRIAQEIAILSDKWDISEEIARSLSHIERFNDIMKGADAGTGRKLDFLVQEMNREINTMGSKMQSAEMRWRIVDAKSCLERVREQIQNID